MSDKLNKFLNSVLAGVVAENNLPDFEAMDDEQVEQYAADIAKKQRQKLSSEFKGQYYSTATKELLKGLQAAGVLEADQVSEFGTLKFDELTAQIGEVVKTKQVANMGESQKEIAAQIEKAKASIKAQYDAQVNELNGKLTGYQQKEYDAKELAAIKKAMPKGFEPNDAQLKSLRYLIKEEADLKFVDESPEPSLFHKNTTNVLGDGKQILDLSDIVPKHLKSMGIWSEKPQPITKDLSGGFKDIEKKDVSVNGNNGGTNDRLKAAQEFKEALNKQ